MTDEPGDAPVAPLLPRGGSRPSEPPAPAHAGHPYPSIPRCSTRCRRRPPTAARRPGWASPRQSRGGSAFSADDRCLAHGPPARVRGVGADPLNIARGVARAGGGHVSVALASFGEEADVVDIEPGVTMHVLPIATRSRAYGDVLSWDLAPLVADADVLHIHQIFSRCGEVGLLAARLARTAVCVTDHGGMSSRLGKSLDILELATRVICYSDFGASLLRTGSPVRIVKGGVDTAFFSPPAAAVPLEHVLYVGRLLAHKGIDRLIIATPADVPLVVCGRPYDDAYFATLRALARGRRVEFVTDADDATLLDLYHRAWTVVLPSVHRDAFGRPYSAPELMGLSLLEGMACGVPVVCARTAAMPEFVEHGVSGYLYDTLGELSNHLQRLVGDAALRARMGRAARAFARQHDIVPVGRRMLEVYGEAAAAV